MQKTKRTAVIGVATLGLIGGGIAFAAWTSTGTGSGTATASHNKDLVVTAGAPEGLYPTGTVTIPVTVKNLNPYNVSLDSITFNGTSTSQADCTATTVTTTSKTGLNDVLATDASVTKEFTVAMSNDAENECQDAVFALSFTASAHSTN